MIIWAQKKGLGYEGNIFLLIIDFSPYALQVYRFIYTTIRLFTKPL